MSIKHDPELRHVLSHLANAIEHLAHGSKDAALHELESIEGLIFWESDEEMRAHLEGDYDGVHGKDASGGEAEAEASER